MCGGGGGGMGGGDLRQPSPRTRVLLARKF